MQSKYFYLRRQSETGKGWYRRERDKVRDQLHKTTTKIANYAEENKLVVAVGNLSGVQNQDKGREMNRKLHRFPHYSFREMLEYKCEKRGFEYIEVNEAYTSQRCSRCGEEGNRETADTRETGAAGFESSYFSSLVLMICLQKYYQKVSALRPEVELRKLSQVSWVDRFDA